MADGGVLQVLQRVVVVGTFCVGAQGKRRKSADSRPDPFVIHPHKGISHKRHGTIRRLLYS